MNSETAQIHGCTMSHGRTAHAAMLHRSRTHATHTTAMKADAWSARFCASPRCRPHRNGIIIA